MTLLALPLILATTLASASVTIYQPGKTPQKLLDPSEFALPGAASRGDAVIEFMTSRAPLLGLSGLSEKSFALRSLAPRAGSRADQPARGKTARYQQTLNQVPVEGAELVALIDASGKLRSLNSSFVNVGSIDTQPTLSQLDALDLAEKALGFEHSNIGAGKGDGLLVLLADGAYRLGWQFSLMDAKTGARPSQIVIAANGADTGKVLRVRAIGHQLEKEVTTRIYDASVIAVVPNPLYKGILVLKNRKPTLRGRTLLSDEAFAAHDNFDATLNTFHEVFGRHGFDNQGSDVVASVRVQRYEFLDVAGQKQNAAWIGPWKLFIFGAGGDLLGGFESALDVIGHEFTHAVIEHSSNLAYGGQSGALNEHLADVFGAFIQYRECGKTNWNLIGETTLREAAKARGAEALRDMLNPEKGLSPQPTHLSETPAELGPDCKPGPENDNCGVHILSGIPNRAVALMVQTAGWEKVSKLLYSVMTDRLRSTSQFDDYKVQVIDECATVLSARECATIEAAFVIVGL